MPNETIPRNREDGLLVELTDLAMDLARDMAGRAKKAEALEDAERAIRGFDRMSRSARLSIALLRRLERDEAREASRRRTEDIELRKARLGARLRSEIRESGAGFSARLEMERELDASLAEEALYQRFLDLPLDQAVTRFRNQLNLVPPPGRSPIEGEVEGVEPHSHLSGLQPPHPAPPEGEHLVNLKPAPS